MINLLPPQEQEELLVLKNKKLVIILGTVIVTSLIGFTLVLLSLKFYVLENIRYHQSIISTLNNNAEAPNLSSLKTTIQKYNTLFTSVEAFYKNEMYVSDALVSVLQISRPKGLYFTGLFAEKAENAVSMSISGISDTRDSLLLFKQNLEDGKRLRNVYFPPDSWIKPTNINFYITLQVFPPEADSPWEKKNE